MDIKDNANNAGDVEVMRYGVINEFVCVLPDDLDRQRDHMTRLTAERDGFKASAKTWQESADSHHLKLVHTQIERDGLLAEVERLREQSNARLFTLTKVQSELTKARETISDLIKYSDNLQGDLRKAKGSTVEGILGQAAEIPGMNF